LNIDRRDRPSCEGISHEENRLDVYRDILINLYFEFSHLEFTTKDGFIAMYAAIEEGTLKKLLNSFVENNVDFSRRFGGCSRGSARWS
jgi:hypothetical protein